MRLHSVTHARAAVALAFGMFAAGVTQFDCRATELDKKTILTVNQRIQVKDTVLEPGRYVLKLVTPDSDLNVVQIFNGDQSHIIDTVLTIPRQRMTPTGKTEFTYWETPPGTVRALRTWFYPGDEFGQEFPYPKQLKEIAMAEPPKPPATPVREVEAAPPAPSEAMREEPAQSPPAETAQNTPPPAATAPAAETQPEPPKELPKTASTAPLIGLSSLVLLGISGLLRLKRLV